jgi:LPS-assembly protein
MGGVILMRDATRSFQISHALKISAHFTARIACSVAALSVGFFWPYVTTSMPQAQASVSTPQAQEAVDVAVENPDETPAVSTDKKPIDLEADAIIHDEERQIVTASGNVELVQDGRILKADKIAYNLRENVAVAEGNVVFMDQNGDTHFAEYATLTQQMREGFIRGLQSTLTDGSRIWAEEAVKKTSEDGDATYIMRQARYTACEPCAENPDRRPAWQIKAEEVEHDEEEKMVRYKNARMEVGGVPIFYTPYYAHPDGTVKQKSGFLTPNFGYSSDLGGFAEGRYYYAISPSSDATIGLMVTGREGALLKGEYRKRFDQADLKLDGSVTHSSRTDSEAGAEVVKDEELRGHLFVDGEWHIDEKWRAGVDLNVTSDDQYLRQYDMGDQDFLESEIYVERFDARDYAGLRLVAFQDLRINRADIDQPNLLPIGEANFMGEPNAMLGGRWHWRNSMLNLSRDGSGQDVSRLISELGWKRQWITNQGIVVDGQTSLRGDVYNTRDRDIAALNPNEDKNKNDARLLPRASVQVSYPLKRDFKDMQLRIEPKAQLVVAADTDNDSSIPNEDSQDTQLDISNLFQEDRFYGQDRVEDKTHASYGVRAGLYGHEGSHLEVYAGQSQRFSKDDNPFSVGSGLNERSSDYVAHVTASYQDRAKLNYRTQIDGDSLQSQRHELYGNATVGRVSLSTGYLYARGIAGTSYAESREEISGATSVDLGDGWSLQSNAVYTLSESDRNAALQNNRGLRSAGVGLSYGHECFDFSAFAERDLTDDTSGGGGTTFMLRIGFKNLGNFQSD